MSYTALQLTVTYDKLRNLQSFVFLAVLSLLGV